VPFAAFVHNWLFFSSTKNTEHRSHSNKLQVYVIILFNESSKINEEEIEYEAFTKAFNLMQILKNKSTMFKI
jgi:hypothetical protein